MGGVPGEDDLVDNIPAGYVAPSRLHGHGLFARAPIAAGERLARLDGQVVPWALHERLALVEEWNALAGDRILVRPYRTKYYYINHSRAPNAEVRRDADDRVEVVALAAIGGNEEITLDYRREPLAAAYLAGHGASYL